MCCGRRQDNPVLLLKCRTLYVLYVQHLGVYLTEHSGLKMSGVNVLNIVCASERRGHDLLEPVVPYIGKVE